MKTGQIEMEHVTKEYRMPHKGGGFTGTLRNRILGRTSTVHAVSDLTLTIQCGEMTGYIGPNGAGKSTTIRMMCGLLSPTAGTVRINGLDPRKERQKVLPKLGVVFGQSVRLDQQMKLGEAFELLRRIYRVPMQEYRENMEELVERLGLTGLLDIPAGQLSLGQRMRGEIAAAMLHSPEILFLDEPTVGLDIDGKRAVRELILEKNRTRQLTVILTSHDLEDVSRLCGRLVVIRDGKIVRDGPREEIVADMAPWRLLKLEVTEFDGRLPTRKAELVSREGSRLVCRFDHHKYSASEVIGELSAGLDILDLSVAEPDIEEAVERIYHP